MKDCTIQLKIPVEKTMELFEAGPMRAVGMKGAVYPNRNQRHLVSKVPLQFRTMEPTPEQVEYIHRRNIATLMNDLVQGLMDERPDDPLQWIANTIGDHRGTNGNGRHDGGPVSSQKVFSAPHIISCLASILALPCPALPCSASIVMTTASAE